MAGEIDTNGSPALSKLALTTQLLANAVHPAQGGPPRPVARSLGGTTVHELAVPLPHRLLSNRARGRSQELARTGS